MSIENSIVRSPSILRTAFGGRLSLWLWHKNSMVSTSLIDLIRFNGLKIHTMSPSHVNIASCWVSNNHMSPIQSQRVANTCQGKIRTNVVCLAVRNRNHIRANHISRAWRNKNGQYSNPYIFSRSLDGLGFCIHGGPKNLNINPSLWSSFLYLADFCCFVRLFSLPTETPSTCSFSLHFQGWDQCFITSCVYQQRLSFIHPIICRPRTSDATGTYLFFRHRHSWRMNYE